jgi:hypothetical protein
MFHISEVDKGDLELANERRAGRYSNEGSKMLLPDASFTKNLYQSSFQE